jgi:membrane-associated HD superfamily phosphohydrolase
MLADGCEATVRSAHDHSPARIRDIVERITQERIAQGQLDESPLTLRDLELTKDAFCAVLNGLYHPRIEYPDRVDLETPATAIAEFPDDPDRNRRRLAL